MLRKYFILYHDGDTGGKIEGLHGLNKNYTNQEISPSMFSFPMQQQICRKFSISLLMIMIKGVTPRRYNQRKRGSDFRDWVVVEDAYGYV